MCRLDLHEGRLHRRLIPGALARFDSDSTRIAIAHYQTITLFDLASGEVLRTLKIDKGSVESLQFVAGGSRLLTASGNWYDGDQGQLLLWDIKSGRRLKSYAPMDKAVTFAQATPDEQRIVATFTRGDAGSAGVDQISVFDSASGERISNLDLSSDLFGGTLLDPQGEFIISGGNSRSGVLLWDLKTLEPRHRFPLHLAALSPDGQVLATHDDRRRLRFWNTDTGEQVGIQVLPLGRVWGQAGVSQFHPGGRLYVGSTTVATRGNALLGRSIGFWNLQSGELEAELLTFDDGREWLIQTAAGHFSGSEEGLRRVAWRRAGTDSIKIDRPRTDEQHQPRRVAETLSRSLPEEQPLIEMLAALPEGPPESVPEPAVKPFQPFQIDLEMRRETIRAFERAGGDVQADIHGYIRSLYMEQRPLNQELIERFAWVRSTERLYLAATGITDDQLEWVGMMGNVRRLSLWGNPITDAGMKHLATLWNLEVLDIHDTAVTAEGLNRLRLLEKMKTLIVPSSVDVAALEPLRRIPNLEIIRRGSRE